MDPISLPALLNKHGIRPSKKLGQNFLNDENVLARIVSDSGVSTSDTVLEIGPGLGSLTRHLARVARNVIAVELDEKLIPALEDSLASTNNVVIIQGDALSLSADGLGLKPGYLIVANIPYYITSALIRHYLEGEILPQRIILTVQKEVAERICAGPGDMSILALSVQFYGDPKILFYVPGEAFLPRPEVDSAVLRIDLKPRSHAVKGFSEQFFRLVKAGFSMKRKTLRNTLSAGLHISKAETERILSLAGVDPQHRAEHLSLEAWLRLCEVFQKI